jgi:hypothetical protein
MRFVSPRLHKMLDYFTIVAFALSPTLVPLAGLPAAIAYGLAIVHLAVTIATAFPGAPGRPLPFRTHGGLEVIVGIALVALPFLAGWTDRARIFYIVAGVVILAVTLVSQYRVDEPSSMGSAA